MSYTEDSEEAGDDTCVLSTRNESDRTPADVERQVMQTTLASSVEELSAAIDAAEWLVSRARTVERLIKQIAIGWIERHGDFDIGQIHYSVGFSIGVKCVNVAQAGRAVLTAAGGDFDAFMTTLVSQPFKHGSVRSLIEKQIYESLFQAHRNGRLISGVPERTLKRFDKRFAARR